jgi:hypothetical protein
VQLLVALAVHQSVKWVLCRLLLRLRCQGSESQSAIHHTNALSVQKSIKYFGPSRTVFHPEFDDVVKAVPLSTKTGFVGDDASAPGETPTTISVVYSSVHVAGLRT